MQKHAPFAGPLWSDWGSTSIGATTVGVAGPTVECQGALVSNNASSSGDIRVVAGSVTVTAGIGNVLALGPNYFPVTNLNQLTFFSSTGTITVGFNYGKP